MSFSVEGPSHSQRPLHCPLGQIVGRVQVKWTRSLICSSARFRADITTKERLHPTTWRSPLLEAVRRCCLRCASRSERTAWASSSARRSFACTHHTTRHRIPASVRSSLSRRVLLSLQRHIYEPLAVPCVVEVLVLLQDVRDLLVGVRVAPRGPRAPR